MADKFMTKWGFGRMKATLTQRMQGAAPAHGTVDFVQVEEILSHPYYIEHLLNSSNTRQQEKRVMEEMCAQLESILTDLENDQPGADLEGALSLIERNSWKLIDATEKAGLLARMDGYVEKLIYQTERKYKENQISQADPMARMLVKCIKKPDLFSRLEDHREKARARRAEKRRVLDGYRDKIQGAMDVGRFIDARALLDDIVALRENPVKIEPEQYDLFIRFEKKVKGMEERFSKRVDEIRKAIENKHFSGASQRLTQLEEEYSREMDRDRELKDTLRAAIIQSCLDEAEKMPDEETACRYLKACCTETYPEYLIMGDWSRKSRACRLFRNHADLLEESVVKAMNHLDARACHTALSTYNEYRHHNLITGNWAPASAVEYLDQYEKSSRDLKTRMEALISIQDCLGQKADPEGRLLLELKSLKERAGDWDQRLISSFESAPNELSVYWEALTKFIDNTLTPVMEADDGYYALKAGERAKEAYSRLEKIAEQRPDWDVAMACVEQLDLLKIRDPRDLTSVMAVYLKKKREEGERLAEAEQLMEEGYLAGTRHMLEPLVRFSAIQVDGRRLDAQIQQQMETIEKEVAGIWKEFAEGFDLTVAELKQQLYRLDEPRLKQLDDSLQQALTSYRDSETLSNDLKTVQGEFSARGRVDQLRRLMVKGVSRGATGITVSDIKQRMAEIDNGLKVHPGYPPLLSLKEEYRQKVLDAMANRLKKQREQWQLYGAMKTIDHWLILFPGQIKDLVPDSEMSSLEKSKAVADELADIAESMWMRHEYDRAVEYAKKALTLCTDHPGAPVVMENNSLREKGLEMLGQVDEKLKAVDRGEKMDLEVVKQLLGEIQSLKFTFRNLRAQDYRYNSLEEYFRKLARLSGLNDSFWLSIRPGDTYLVFLRDRVRVGAPGDDAADLKILGGGMKTSHATLCRHNGGFYLEAGDGACTVDDEKVTRHALAPGVEIRFGRFPFEVTAIDEGTMVLATTEMNLPDPTIYGVILMASELVVGPDRRKSHLFAPCMTSTVRLELKDRKLMVDGAEEQNTLMPGNSWQGQGISIEIGDK